MSENEEIETIDGFDIPKRELTAEEAVRPLTIERIRDFHYEVGEDFLDLVDSSNPFIFAGYILHKYPKKAKEILEVVNKKKKYLEVMSFNHELDVYYYDWEEDIDSIYRDYCEFINLTEENKARDNQVLIQVMEYYKRP